MSFRHTPDCDYITCAAFGLNDYPIPISTSNHLLLNLADLKTPPERIECQFLSRDIGLIRSAEEVMPSSAMLADALVHMKNGQGQVDVSASKGPVPFEKDELDCAGEDLHPALVGTDEMWEDDPYGFPQGTSTSSSSAAPPAPPLQDTSSELGPNPGGKRPLVSGEPVDLPKDESGVPKITQRLRRKTEDPVHVEALKKMHDKLRNENELYKLHLKHYHLKLDQFKKRTSLLKTPADIYELYEQVVKKCETCSKFVDGPPRAKVSGMRSEIFGELLFIDHASVK